MGAQKEELEKLFSGFSTLYSQMYIDESKKKLEGKSLEYQLGYIDGSIDALEFTKDLNKRMIGHGDAETSN